MTESNNAQSNLPYEQRNSRGKLEALLQQLQFESTNNPQASNEINKLKLKIEKTLSKNNDFEVEGEINGLEKEFNRFIENQKHDLRALRKGLGPYSNKSNDEYGTDLQSISDKGKAVAVQNTRRDLQGTNSMFGTIPGIGRFVKWLTDNAEK